MNSRTLLFGIVGVVLLVAIAIGGYYLVIRVDEQHEENIEHLSEFGVKVIPIRGGGPNEVTIGTQGQIQLPPSIPDKKLSPTEKVIIALSKEKEQLLAELAEEKRKVEELTEEVTRLRRYYEENERYAPAPISEEKQRVAKLMMEYFDKSSDAAHFNRFQKQAAVLASADMWAQLLRKYRLVMSDTAEQEILKTHLPAYGFCIADDIVFVPNGPAEERKLLEHLQDSDNNPLTGQLAEDFNKVAAPCVRLLNDRVTALL